MTDAIFYKIYSKADSIKSRKRNKMLNGFSVGLKVFAMLILVLAVAKEIRLVLVSVALYAVGITLRQIFLETTDRYVYQIAGNRFSVSKVSVFGKEKQLFDGVIDWKTRFINPQNAEQFATKDAIIATEKTDFSAISFDFSEKTVTIIFSPDDYMTALINNQMRRNHDIP